MRTWGWLLASAAVSAAIYGCAQKFVVETNDGGPDADAPAEASVPADAAETGALVDAAASSRCREGAPFGAPVLLTELATSQGEVAATLSRDELTIVFARAGTLFVANRDDRDSPFRSIRNAGPPGSGNDDNPAMTRDGRLVFFSTADRGDSGDSEVFFAAFSDGGLGPASPVRGVLPGTTDPFPNADASALYVSAARDGGEPDLFVVNGIFGPMPSETRLPVSDPESDGQPVLSWDELSLYMGSRRTGGIGGNDMFVASRTRTSDPFSGTTWLGAAVNSTANDLPSWISEDGCVLYFSSDRPGGAGGRDLYRATRGR